MRFRVWVLFSTKGPCAHVLSTLSSSSSIGTSLRTQYVPFGYMEPTTLRACGPLGLSWPSLIFCRLLVAVRPDSARMGLQSGKGCYKLKIMRGVFVAKSTIRRKSFECRIHVHVYVRPSGLCNYSYMYTHTESPCQGASTSLTSWEFQ